MVTGGARSSNCGEMASDVRISLLIKRSTLVDDEVIIQSTNRWCIPRLFYDFEWVLLNNSELNGLYIINRLLIELFKSSNTDWAIGERMKGIFWQ